MPARPPRARSRRASAALVAVGAALIVVACGASEAASPSPVSGTVGGVGVLPDVVTPGDTTATPPPPEATRPAAPSSTVATVVPAGVVGDAVDGNRVLVIGDSLVASTSRRYGGQMCAALVPLGWAVEVDAETGRFIDFGDRVLDRRLRPDQGVDWDAAVVFLGNNYNGDEVTFRAGLEDVVARLAPRPVVLLTVTEFRADRAEVNEIVHAVAAANAHVLVIEWDAITAADDSLLGDDGLHLTDAGRGRLAYEVAAVLGGAPAGEPPACLSTSFSDDSAGAPPTAPPRPRSGSAGPATTTTVPRGAGASTTVARATTTVAATPTTAAAPPTTTVVTPPAPTTALVVPTTVTVGQQPPDADGEPEPDLDTP
jgi:hypothetical protein